MSYRLQQFFFSNWVFSLGVLVVWFIYAALRDGPAVHENFLGRQSEPWVFLFLDEALVALWYFLPSRQHSRHIRGAAALFGLLGLAEVLLVPALLSRPLTLSFELAISIYVFASILAYTIFWPSD